MQLRTSPGLPLVGDRGMNALEKGARGPQRRFKKLESESGEGRGGCAPSQRLKHLSRTKPVNAHSSDGHQTKGTWTAAHLGSTPKLRASPERETRAADHPPPSSREIGNILCCHTVDCGPQRCNHPQHPHKLECAQMHSSQPSQWNSHYSSQTSQWNSHCSEKTSSQTYFAQGQSAQSSNVILHTC